MNEVTGVQLNPATAAAVFRMLNVRGDKRSLYQLVDAALQAWLQEAITENPQAAHAAARGYNWKSLFLPEGTLVRFDYKRQTYHAQVLGDRIVYQGRPYSPRALLLHITGSVRNAWHELWLRCPGEHRWHLADTRRHILRRTPRGLHKRGIDTPMPAPEAPAQERQTPAQQPQAPAETSWCQTSPSQIERSLRAIAWARYNYMRTYLYRDDLVRPDQPNLSCYKGGAGPSRAGRSGPRERRRNNLVP